MTAAATMSGSRCATGIRANTWSASVEQDFFNNMPVSRAKKWQGDVERDAYVDGFVLGNKMLVLRHVRGPLGKANSCLFQARLPRLSSRASTRRLLPTSRRIDLLSRPCRLYLTGSRCYHCLQMEHCFAMRNKFLPLLVVLTLCHCRRFICRIQEHER